MLKPRNSVIAHTITANISELTYTRMVAGVVSRSW